VYSIFVPERFRTDRHRRARVLGAPPVIALLLVVTLCGCDQEVRPIAPDHAPAKYAPDEQLAPLGAQPTTDLRAPTLSSRLASGRCAHQDDCSRGQVCVAIAPTVAECRDGDLAVRVPGRAPNGRPAPPIGLLDGQMMREHVAPGPTAEPAP
jgi:hypothetical protein